MIHTVVAAIVGSYFLRIADLWSEMRATIETHKNSERGDAHRAPRASPLSIRILVRIDGRSRFAPQIGDP